MSELGFEAYLDQNFQAPIIASFRHPQHPAFRFEDSYEGLRREGMVIYPGKLGSADCF